MTDKVEKPEQAAEKPAKAPKPKYEGPVCSVCGKPLSDPESIKVGIGALCRKNGWTQEMITARLSNLQLPEVPENYVKLAEVAKLCKANDIPVARLVRASGGDRAMVAALSPMFQPVYVGKTRWLPEAAMSEEGLAFLSDPLLGQPAKERKPREKKEKKPSDKAASTGKKQKGAVNADAFMAAVLEGTETK